MTPTDYNTVEGITAAIGTTYEELVELLDARHEAYYVRKERLDTFVIDGRVYTDACGNAMLITEPADNHWTYGHGRVVRAEDAHRIIKAYDGGQGRIASTSRHLPNADNICPCCGKGFDLTNFHLFDSEQGWEKVDGAAYVGKPLMSVVAEVKSRTDGIYYLCEYAIRNEKHIDMIPERGSKYPKNEHGLVRRRTMRHDGEWSEGIDPDTYLIEQGDFISFQKLTFKHSPCRAKELWAEVSTAFLTAFRDAGFGTDPNFGQFNRVRQVPNEYGSLSYRGPWFEIQTDQGTFKVGWRKRVIELNWSGTGTSYLHLFNDVNDTKDNHLIHAYTYEDLTKYLKRIREEKALQV